MAAIANMTAVAANGLPTLRATPLFKTPIKGMPAPATRDHAAKTKYDRIRVAPAETIARQVIVTRAAEAGYVKLGHEGARREHFRLHIDPHPRPLPTRGE